MYLRNVATPATMQKFKHATSHDKNFYILVQQTIIMLCCYRVVFLKKKKNGGGGNSEYFKQSSSDNISIWLNILVNGSLEVLVPSASLGAGAKLAGVSILHS